MPQSQLQKQQKKGCLNEQQRNYNEVISYLDNHWSQSTSTSMDTLHAALGNIAPTIPTIMVTGTNGKSTTINYLSKLLQTEGLVVGTFSSPHFSLYNERFAINNSMISHETFTKIANTILNLCHTNNITASSKEILTAMSALYFQEQNIDIAIIEQENLLEYDPTCVYAPKMLGITRIITHNIKTEQNILANIFNTIKKNTYIACADQSKILLQKLIHLTKETDNKWIMPIRKVACLPYPYEQLHGRCAALAERIAQVYVDTFLPNFIHAKNHSLLRASKKQRGRPSLTLHKTTFTEHNLESFWKNIDTTFANRFQIIPSKNHTLILDNASNIDALQNLLLGIRLLNYHKPWKNIFVLFSTYQENFNKYELIKTMRYFFKKNSGNLIIFPLSNAINEQQGTPWNIDDIAITAQNAKIKITISKNFKIAYESIIKTLNDEQDLFVITGSQAIISEYLNYKKEA